MPDSIKELIIKNRVAALTGITTANGYDNTILSVQRRMQGGQSFRLTPMLLLAQDAEDKEGEATEPLTRKKLLLVVSIVTRIDEVTDARSADEVLNSLAADVERAWMADWTCGGYALNSDYEGSGQLDVMEGQPEIGMFVMFSVSYRHKTKDPKSL